MCPGGGGGANALGRCSSCHRQPLLLPRHSRGSDPAASPQSPASLRRWETFSGQRLACVVATTSCSGFLGATPVRLCSLPGAFGPGVASGRRLPSSFVTSRFRGSPIALQLPGAGSPRGERLDRCLCISATPLPGLAAAAWVADRAGPRWSLELAPSPRPPKFAALLFRGGGSAPQGGRWLGLELGVWRPPGLGRLLEA